jgi:hypothetical protein
MRRRSPSQGWKTFLRNHSQKQFSNRCKNRPMQVSHEMLPSARGWGRLLPHDEGMAGGTPFVDILL